MTRISVALAALSMILAGCGGDDPPQRKRAVAACEPRLETAFRAWADAGFSGSVAIATGGRFDCLAAYGLADETAGRANTVDTVFSIGSVSKAFTAAAVLGLVDAGELALDDRAGDVVPGLSGPAAAATVRQLLLHTSGLSGSHGEDHEPLSHDAAVAAISGLERAFEPGYGFNYSNAGYTLLALIVEHASGTPYRDYMAAQILRGGGFWDGEPAAAGPRAVGYPDGGRTDQMGDFAGPHWATSGNGDLAMTMRELAGWTHDLFTGAVVPPAAVERIRTPGYERGDGTAESPGWVAYDESLYGEPFLATAGGGGATGHNTMVLWVPGREQVVAMTSNTRKVSAEALVAAVGPALLAGDPLPVPDTPAADADPAELEAVAGRYELRTGGSLTVSARDDRLAIAAEGSDAIAALHPVHGGFSADDVAEHEARVLALLSGETEEGREERAALEDFLGGRADVRVAGTIVEAGELRTYVDVGPALAWYAVEPHGGIAAAGVPAEPPELVLAHSAAGAYRPDAPAGNAPDVAITFDGRRLRISGPAGTTVARRAR